MALADGRRQVDPYERLAGRVPGDEGALQDVRALADGSIYTGRQALELGLVDEVGTLDNAIAKAAELGGIEGEPRVVELKPTPAFFDMLYGLQARSAIPTMEEILGWAGAPSVQFRSVGP